MNLIELIKNNFELFSTGIFGGVGSLFGWLIARRKNNADVKSAELDNANKLIETYQKSLDDLEKRHEKTHNDNAYRIDLLEKSINTFQDKLDELQDQIDLWKNKYNQLKKEFDTYKKSVEQK